jgi:hypothetical protein
LYLVNQPSALAELVVGAPGVRSRVIDLFPKDKKSKKLKIFLFFSSLICIFAAETYHEMGAIYIIEGILIYIYGFDHNPLHI